MIAGAAMFAGGALAPLRAERSTSTPKPSIVGSAVLVGPGAPIREATTAALAARAEGASDPALHAQLGIAYLQRSRDEAEPALLPLAETALDRSLQLSPRRNLEAFVGMAGLANARHDFSASVEWSRRAIATSPYEASPYGLLGDALFELGRFRAADAAYQKMVDVRPDVASYVRASYALQHHGRTEAAIRVMTLALKAAGPTGETAAWVRHQLGDVYAGIGDNREAARQNRIGMEMAPGYAPPMVGLAESHAARGKLAKAIDVLEVAAAELPSVEYLVTLGDLYRATGRDGDARVQYRAAERALAEYRSAGVLPDADFVLFYADRGVRPEAALREAFAIYRDRPTAKTADALAWMLHSGGRDRAAWGFAAEALADQPRDASIAFHSAAIARSLGRDAVAARLARRAVAIDPAFSVTQAPTARRIARRP